MERLIAIGDIHGCYHTLLKLLENIKYDGAADAIVFLGDYIDRGKFSYEVITYIRNLQHKYGVDKVICLRGNHEQMMIDAVTQDLCPDTNRLNPYGTAASLWFSNGGKKTVNSLRKHKQSVLRYLPWLKSLPLVYDTPEIIFCHAGLSSPLLKDNTPDDLLWGRDWLALDKREREKQVIFGHTPLYRHAYVAKSGDICIDAGCVYGGSLCALILHEDGNSDTVHVNKHELD